MWKYKKLSKAQTWKKSSIRWYFRAWLGNLGKKITDLVIPLATDVSSGLVSNLASNATNQDEQKITGKRAARGGKKFTLFISNDDINDIIKVIKSLENPGVLIDRVTKTAKH